MNIDLLPWTAPPIQDISAAGFFCASYEVVLTSKQRADIRAKANRVARQQPADATIVDFIAKIGAIGEIVHILGGDEIPADLFYIKEHVAASLDALTLERRVADAVERRARASGKGQLAIQVEQLRGRRPLGKPKGDLKMVLDGFAASPVLFACGRLVAEFDRVYKLVVANQSEIDAEALQWLNVKVKGHPKIEAARLIVRRGLALGLSAQDADLPVEEGDAQKRIECLRREYDEARAIFYPWLAASLYEQGHNPIERALVPARRVKPPQMIVGATQIAGMMGCTEQNVLRKAVRGQIAVARTADGSYVARTECLRLRPNGVRAAPSREAPRKSEPGKAEVIEKHRFFAAFDESIKTHEALVSSHFAAFGNYAGFYELFDTHD